MTARQEDAGDRPIKVVVWDLDQTVWDGILLEGGASRLRTGVSEVVTSLDRRGVLHSIASRNEPADALARLAELGLAEFFLHPRIGWGAKSDSVAAIAADFGIGLDAIAFVDDDPVERAEVSAVHPEVRCFTPDEVSTLTSHPALRAVATAESATRRQMYRSDLARTAAEQEYSGPRPEFLASLEMRLVISPAEPADLARMRELTIRTNQLNSTGRTYDIDELRGLLDSGRHDVLVAELTDRFGGYGKIGLAVVEQDGDRWVIRLLLTSCRVLNRGIGGILLNIIANRAAAAGVALFADFADTGRNRPMYVAFRLAGFRPGPPSLLECDTTMSRPIPPYLMVVER
ncbi:HAD-IIIC family phosphatase [Amycolatopsis sp. NPDC005003]